MQESSKSDGIPLYDGIGQRCAKGRFWSFLVIPALLQCGRADIPDIPARARVENNQELLFPRVESNQDSSLLAGPETPYSSLLAGPETP